MTYEDFTGYDEVDEDNDITVTTNKIDVSSIRRDALSYVRLDKTADHFGDFEHLITTRYVTASGANATSGIWMLSDAANTIQGGADGDDGLQVLWYYNGANDLRIYLFDREVDNYDYYVFPDSNAKTVYLTIKRDGTTLTCDIYNDSSRTDLQDHLEIVCQTEQYRYVFGMMSWQIDALGSLTITYYTENLDLQEAAPPVIKTVAGKGLISHTP